MKPISIILALLTLVGCATSTITTEERVQRGVRIAVQTGVIVDLKAHPERRFAYQQASMGLQNLVKEERWDAGAFALALSSTGNNLFTGGNASLILTTVPEFISLVTGDSVDLQETRYVKPAIIGANDGLATALNATK